MNSEKSKFLIRELKVLEKDTKVDINRLRSSLALERLLARIVSDPYLEEHLVFKGGFVMFKVYGSSRYTRDIDALALNVNLENLKSRVSESIKKDISDGFWFGDLQIENLEHQGEYAGIRFDSAFQIGDPILKKIHKLSRVHFDIGIGDTINNPLTLKLEPMIPVGDSISWKVYPPEFIYSEKLETLVKRGSLNSRAKDFYDLKILFEKIHIEELAKAIRMTFINRHTDIPNSFADFLNDLNFASIKPSWSAQGFGSFSEAKEKLSKDLKEIDSILKNI